MYICLIYLFIVIFIYIFIYLLIHLFIYIYLYLYYIYMAMSQEPGTLPPASWLMDVDSPSHMVLIAFDIF